MPSTTVKVSTTTRDRLKAASAGSADDTINLALDALERAAFWARAERASRAQHGLPPEVRHQLQRQEAAIDTEFEHLG